MLSNVDHYTSLLRAVARLDGASYEARGAIYDRALTALVRRLTSTVPPYSKADIDRELLAFREAVRRVEFGELDGRERLAQQAMADQAMRRDLRQDLDQALHPSARPSPTPSPTRAARRATRPATSIDAPPAPRPEFMADAAEPPPIKVLRGGLFGRIVRRVALAAVLVAIGFAGYAAFQVGQFDLSAFGELLERVAGLRTGATTAATEPAMYYEQAESRGPWREIAGKASWHTGLEEAASSGSHKPFTVLTLDVQVPERGLSLTMTIRRDAGGDAAITHLIDLKFADAQGAPMSGVTAVANLVMKQADGSGSSALAGRSIRVAPGLFLFGLSGDKADAPHNAEALRALPRLDIAFAFANGTTGIISVNKGASGDRAFAEALANWAR